MALQLQSPPDDNPSDNLLSKQSSFSSLNSNESVKSADLQKMSMEEANKMNTQVLQLKELIGAKMNALFNKNPVKKYKKFSNQHLVRNPFKPSEDPLGLSQARILTKQDMQICNWIYEVADRLGCLDENEKVDRKQCIELLCQLQSQNEEKAIYELIREIGHRNKIPPNASKFLALSKQKLATDDVFRFSRDRLSKNIPHARKIFSRKPEHYSGIHFNVHNLIEEEKEKDISDIHELLKHTNVQKSYNEMIMKEIIQISKQFNLNLDVKGNLDFDPSKPDLKDLVNDEDLFKLKFTGLCSKADAFQKYKQNVRDTLDQNKEHKLKVADKRRLEIEQIKIAVKLIHQGIENIKYSELKDAAEYELISKIDYNNEKARRQSRYREKQIELKKAKLIARSLRKSQPQKKATSVLSPIHQSSNEYNAFTALQQRLSGRIDSRLSGNHLPTIKPKEVNFAQSTESSLDYVDKSILEEQTFPNTRPPASSISLYSNKKENLDLSRETPSSKFDPRKNKLGQSQINFNNTNSDLRNTHNSFRFPSQDFAIQTNFRRVKPLLSQQKERERVERRMINDRTPKVFDREIQDLIKKYPIQKHLAQNFTDYEHLKQVRFDHHKLGVVLDKTDKELKDSHKFLKEFITDKLCMQVEQEDTLRTTQIVHEMNEVDQKLMKPLFLSRLRDELDYITHCKEATNEYKNQRYTSTVKTKVKRKPKYQGLN